MNFKIITGNKNQKEELGMCTKWKWFTFKAIMLALLSFTIFGCGTASNAPAQRTVNGIVSDSTGALPFANALVTAYAIDAAGNVTTQLSATVQSDGQGNFYLTIPASYVGGIELVAKETTGAGTITLYSVLPSVSQNQAVISPATNMVYQYVLTNNGGSFTSGNIQTATLVLEAFFGPNFTQIPPPAIGSAPTPAQQQQIAVTQAINLLVSSGTTLQALVTVDPATTIISLGEGANFAALNSALSTTITALIGQGLVPGSFTVTITPVPVPVITDTIPPSAPPNLAATATSASVSLTWGAATDNIGVTAYYIYRNGAFVTSVAASTLTYTDNAVNSATTYTYEVRARDAAGNVSAGSSVTVATAAILTYTISGKVATGDGTGLPSVFVVITGDGSGVSVTDANGNYTITGVRAGKYTLTPTFSGYMFTPASTAITVTTADITGQNFTAVAVNPGTVSGGVTYPPGTIIGGVSYPSGAVIGGITYPTATIIGGITYPTGTVIGGITYPNGVVIGGVSYPAGTIVGGIAFPLGTVTTGITIPSGTVIGGITYPTGTATAGTIYPTGTANGSVSYPTATVVGGVTYPAGVVNGSVTYPSGSIASQVQFASVSGRVVRAPVSSEVPNVPVGVAGVTVNVVNASLVTVASTPTDSTGAYSFASVPNGSYTITVTVPITVSVPAPVNSETFTTITYPLSGNSITIASSSSVTVGDILLSP